MTRRGRRSSGRFDWRRRLEQGEEIGWVLCLKCVFLAVLVGLIVLSAVVSNVGIAVLLALIAGAMLKTIIPYDEFRDWCDDVWHGDVSVGIRSSISSGYNRVKGAIFG